MKPRRTNTVIARFSSKLIAAFFVVCMALVWEHVKALNIGKELKDLEKETDRLTYENGRMSMQIHQWESPSHLDVVARKDFGMIPLDDSHVIGVNGHE